MLRFHDVQPPRAVAVALVLGSLAWGAAAPPSVRAFTLRETSNGKQVRWGQSKVSLRLGSRFTELFAGDATSAATMAAEAWRGLPGVPDIVIAEGEAEGYTSSRRTNGVYLLESWPFQQGQLAITVSSYAADGELLGADVLLNGEHAFALLSEGEQAPSSREHDLGAVLTHEFGHVLGLGESQDDEMATMYPFIQKGEVHQRTLEDDDEEGAIAAYERPLPGAAACSVARPGRRANGFAIGWLMLACAPLLRRLRRHAVG